MTGKERVKAAINFETVDHVPAALLDGGVWIADHAGYSFDELTALEDGGAQIVFDYYEKMKSDIIYAGCGCGSMVLRALGAEGNFGERGKSGEVKPLSADPDFYADFDLTSIRSKLLADPGVQGIIRQTRRLRELVGQDKYITSGIGAPFTYAGMLMGVQDLMINLYDEDINLQPLFRVASTLALETNRIFLEAGADMVFLGDPVASGALISQSMFEEFALPLLKEIIPKLHDTEPVLLHICGNTTERLECLKDIGIDAFSLDTVDLETALTIAKGHYAIFGNLSPFDVMASMTAQQVKELSMERCRIAGKQGGYILAPGCDLPNATPIENVLAMVEGACEA